jgi:hypothetical protein
MSAVNGVSRIPTEGKNLVVVAVVDQVLHFRIFDGDGKMVVDTDEKRLTERVRPIQELRNQLERLWPSHELTGNEKGRVITAVTSIIDHTPWKRWSWTAPSAPGGNSDWFARYWLAQWGGGWAPPFAGEAVIELPEQEKNPEEKDAFISTGVRLPSSVYKRKVFESCSELLERLPASSPLLGWVRSELKSSPLLSKAQWHQAYINSTSLADDEVELTAKLDGLKQKLGEMLLFPRSPVRVALPAATAVADPGRRHGYVEKVRRRLLDFRASVRWWARDFAETLVATGAEAIGPAEARATESPARLAWRDEWWRTWFRRLFRPGAGPDFEFVPADDGFIIEESLIGLDALGGGDWAYDQSELMLF